MFISFICLLISLLSIGEGLYVGNDPIAYGPSTGFGGETGFGGYIGTTVEENVRFTYVHYKIAFGTYGGMSFAVYNDITPLSTPLASITGLSITVDGSWDSSEMVGSTNVVVNRTRPLVALFGRPGGLLPDIDEIDLGCAPDCPGLGTDVPLHDIAVNIPGVGLWTSNYRVAIYFEYEFACTGDGPRCTADGNAVLCTAGVPSNSEICSFGCGQSGCCHLGEGNVGCSCTDPVCSAVPNTILPCPAGVYTTGVTCPFGCHNTTVDVCWTEREVGRPCSGPATSGVCSASGNSIQLCTGGTLDAESPCAYQCNDGVSPNVCFDEGQVGALCSSSYCFNASEAITCSGGVVTEVEDCQPGVLCEESTSSCGALVTPFGGEFYVFFSLAIIMTFGLLVVIVLAIVLPILVCRCKMQKGTLNLPGMKK